MIELLVALAVAGIAFSALAYSQIMGFRVTRSSQGAAIAKDLGMKQLELLRGWGYDEYRGCPSTSPSSSSDLPDCAGSGGSSEHPSFTVHWSIDDFLVAGVALDPPALKRVDVWVTWEDTRYDLVGYLSCGDPGETAMTEVPCPTDSLLSSTSGGG